MGCWVRVLTQLARCFGAADSKSDNYHDFHSRDDQFAGLKWKPSFETPSWHGPHRGCDELHSGL